ncbi:Gamma-tubulin complex component 2 [Perkinsus chesapeaki]|uniref:Spindle pole body component n=1 Tax=Perkinsus chesapeaki TaxID=330153 RepID=A0A7J6L273_PERCH|nr:Gamma-tubulin complex component 2 [Perkinsus chesapeaki]
MEAPSAAVEKAKSEESTECGGFWHGTDVGIKSATGSGYLACKLVDDSSFTGLPTKVDINERLKVSAMGSHPFHTAAGDGYTRGHSSQWKVVCPGKSEGALHYGDSVALVKKVHSSLSIASSFAGAAADEAAGGSKATSVITVALCIDKEASVGAMALPVSAHGGLSKLKLPELCRWTIVCPDDLDSKEAVPLRSPRVLLRNRWGQYLSVADVTASSGHSSALYCRESSKRQECLWLIGRIDMILPSCGVLEDNDEEEEGPWPFVPLLPRPDFSTMSTEAQERLLILEILGAILGGRVSHITERSATHRRAPEEATNEGSSPWAVRRRLMLCGLGGCDISLQQVATQMLPLLEQLQFVKTFIKEHEGWGFGSVCEGLCEELNSLISDIYLRVAELRSKVEGSSEMTLSAVKLCLLSTSQELDLACRVLRKCWHKRGGAIVDSVYDQRTTVHDGALHLRLLSATVTPFLSLLYDWMLQGRLVSSPPVQQQEFLIVDTAPDLPCSSQEAEKFWNERFLIVTELTPFFINNTMERKILEAGRALRVLKTNTFLPTPPSEILKLCSLPGTPMDEAWRRSLAILVDKAQKWAVEQLYTFFIKSLDLKARLSSIHYHFLLCRSDWLSHFLDTAGDELEAQLVDSVDMNRINTLLELAIRSTASSTHTDPYCGEVVACMQTFLTEETPRKLASRSYTPYSIVQRSGDASRAPTGIRCFTLGLREVQWPLSLVLSTPAVFKLQVIFRHLCYCRWVQNRLSEVWLDFQSTKPFYSPGQDTEGASL